ncbi:MAG: hypothetical protein J5862_04000, partial [Bacteroidales bacterium]|nr:hypothetical protein [Bacteroidales bacterium]
GLPLLHLGTLTITIAELPHHRPQAVQTTATGHQLLHLQVVRTTITDRILLPLLQEVQATIEVHHLLPEVPHAQAIQAEAEAAEVQEDNTQHVKANHTKARERKIG